MSTELLHEEEIEYTEEDTVDISNVFALHGLDAGCCRKLLGKVVLVSFLVDDAESKWTDDAEAKFVEVMKDAEEKIMAQSGRSKSELMIVHARCRVSVPYVVTRKNHDSCIKDVLRRFGYRTVSEYQAHYEEKFARNEAPIFFVFNKPFRSYASRVAVRASERSDAALEGSEWAFLSYKPEHENTQTLIHELMHQFGAIDYYYPEQVKALANAYFPESIMDSGGVIDPLTRYIIGWDEELAPEATAFLRDVSSVSEEEVLIALKKEWEKEF